ncbi:MAG: flagellar basal body protein FliL [Alphaproteobacteria bacterium]|nr:MAG: flagellar basal body protein FliL [Alphaproteobacteria bacterium]
MSESKEQQLDDDEAPKKGKKGLIIIVLAVVLLGGGGAGLFFSGMLDSLIGKDKKVAEATDGDASSDSEQAADGNGTDAKKEKVPVAFLELPEVVANLQSSTGGSSFIKAKITIEAPSEEIRVQLEKNQPIIMDAINTYVRELRPNDLKGSAGTFLLQEELTMRVNKAIHPNEINKILIEQLLIQ